MVGAVFCSDAHRDQVTWVYADDVIAGLGCLERESEGAGTVDIHLYLVPSDRSAAGFGWGRPYRPNTAGLDALDPRQTWGARRRHDWCRRRERSARQKIEVVDAQVLEAGSKELDSIAVQRR